MAPRRRWTNNMFDPARARSFEECEQMKRESSWHIAAPKTYASFADLIREQLWSEDDEVSNASIITFNYDVALEFALALKDMPYDYHLHPRDYVAQVGMVSGSVPVLKLHGSLNWRVEQRDQDEFIEALGPESLDWHGDAYALDTQWPCIYRAAGGSGVHIAMSQLPHTLDSPGEPFIVPPTWFKLSQYMPIYRVWRRAAAAIREAKYIYVIGYSMPHADQLVRLLYALGGVWGERLRCFAVYNPDDAVDARFRSLVGAQVQNRYEFHRMRFSEAVGHIRSRVAPS